MFKIDLDICEYQPYLNDAIPQLLKSTESATRSLFNVLMVVKRYSMLNLYNKFDSRDQMQYHAFLRKCIDSNIIQYGNPLPANCGRLMSCVTTLPAKNRSTLNGGYLVIYPICLSIIILSLMIQSLTTLLSMISNGDICLKYNYNTVTLRHNYR